MPTKLLLSRAKLLLSYYRRPLSPTVRLAAACLRAPTLPARPACSYGSFLVLVLDLILLVAPLLLLALVVGLDAVALHHLELRGDLAQARLVVFLVAVLSTFSMGIVPRRWFLYLTKSPVDGSGARPTETKH